MQMVQKGNHPGESSVLYLPMIDMNSNDMTCIYSTLHFVSSHAKQYNVTPIRTFDQPLWWKALQIIKSDLRLIVVRLGGFHTEMSFLGCIGHTMAGSGLKDVLELIYASNAVEHMLSGKAVERAVRGHFLIDTTLNAMLVAKLFNVELLNKVRMEDTDRENGDYLSDCQSVDDLLNAVPPQHPEKKMPSTINCSISTMM